MQEVWVKLFCCNEVEVSNLGNLRRLKRKLQDGREYKQKDIPLCYKQRYARFAYTHKGKRRFMSVHRAVFFSFNDCDIPDNPHSVVVDHIDGDTHNNRLENLQLITQSQNIKKSNLFK